jgi:hypothetical protein
MERNRRTIPVALVLSLCYLLAYYCLDFKRNILFEQPGEKSASGFVWKPQEYLRLRSPAGITILANRNIERLQIEWKERRAVTPVRVSDRIFVLRIEEDLHIARIVLVPKMGQAGGLTLRISRKPVIRIQLLLFQLAFVFFLAKFILEISGWLIRFLGRKKGNDGPGEAIQTGIVLVSLLFVYALFHPSLYLALFREWKVLWAGALFINLAYAAFLGALYCAFRKRPERRIALPFIFSLLIFFLTPSFKLEICGDALEWLRIIRSLPLHFGHYDSTTISFAESLSLLLGKSLLALARPVFGRFDPAAVYTVIGKAMGIFYLFMLHRFVSDREDLSERQKLLLYLLASSLPAGAFFLGYPEFAYYALPFLLLGFVLASRYLARPRSGHFLLLASIALTVGGLFHGSAFFSLPALFLLPFIKLRQFPEPRPVRFYLRSSLLTATGVALPVFLMLAVVSLSGYRTVFFTALGGAGGGKFVEMFPNLLNYWNDKIFLEKSYLFLRGWIFLVGFPAPLILFGLRRARRIQISTADALFFLMAALQMVIVLFWGFDLNIKDFDLYMAPLTLLSLFLLKDIAAAKFTRDNAARELALILIFALASPIGLFLAMTSA